MADYQKVEINEKAPNNEIEPDQQQATEVEEPQEQQERPEWLPEKFESADKHSLEKLTEKLESRWDRREEQEQVEEEAYQAV